MKSRFSVGRGGDFECGDGERDAGAGRWLAVGVAVGFLVVNLVLVFCHELGLADALAWSGGGLTFDEFTAGMIDAGPLYYLANSSSLLWSLLMMALSALGIGAAVANYLALVLTTVALWIFLRQLLHSLSKRTREADSGSALLWWMRRHGALVRVGMTLMVAFSAGFFYYTAAISSGASVAALAVAVVMIVYGRREEWPLLYALSLLLLALSSFYLAGLAAVMAAGAGVEWGREIWERGGVARARRGVTKARGRTSGVRAGGELLEDRLRRELSGARIWRKIASIIIYILVVGNFCAIIINLLQIPFWENWDEVDGFLIDLNTSIFGGAFPVVELLVIFTLVGLVVRYPKVFFYATGGFVIYFLLVFVKYLQLGFMPVDATVLINLLLAFYLLVMMETPRRMKWLGRLEIVKFLQRYTTVGLWLMIPVALSVPATVGAAMEEVTGTYDYVSAATDYLNQLPEGAEIAVAGLSEDDGVLVAALVPFLDGRHAVVEYGNEVFWERAGVGSSAGEDNYAGGVTGADEEAGSGDGAYAGVGEATLMGLDEEVEEVWSRATELYLLTAATTCGNENALEIPEGWAVLERFDRFVIYRVPR